jgi:hypothetical protein
MEEVFKNQSLFIIKQLSTLAVMRIRLEAKEQVLLQKTINLNRFIRLASLDHLRDSPEMANAKKFLEIISAGSGNFGTVKTKRLRLETDPNGEFQSNLN